MESEVVIRNGMSDDEEELDQNPKQETALGHWVDTLSKQKMPALASTVHKMSKLTTDEDSRVSQLSDEVLKDPNLTSRVLQVANSVIYRGVAGSCATITRAIVLMGFTTIRDISLSMKILDEMLKNSPSVHLKNVLAKSFHAAMQARGMVSDKKHGMKEEVFIAGLLHHIGEMSMLSRDNDTSKELDSAIHSGVAPDQASKKILGVSFTELSKGLAEQWQLSSVLRETLQKPEIPSKPAEAVLLGEELSQVAALGWDSDEVLAVMRKISKFTNQEIKECLDQAKIVADHAKDISTMYGADSVKHLIPPSNYTKDTAERLNVVTLIEPEVEETTSEGGIIIPAKKEQKVVELDITPDMIEAALNYKPLAEIETKQDPEEDGEAETVVKEASKGVDNTVVKEEVSSQPDASLQLDYMTKIGDLLSGKRTNVNEVFKVILDGMEKAVRLDRVVMCLVTKDRKKLIPRSYRGDMSEEMVTGFGFDLSEDNAFSFALRQAQPLWLGSERMKGRGYLVTDPIKRHVKTANFFVAPIVVSRRPIGIFYADMESSNNELTEIQFVNFNSLAQQASIALSTVD